MITFQQVGQLASALMPGVSENALQEMMQAIRAEVRRDQGYDRRWEAQQASTSAGPTQEFKVHGGRGRRKKGGAYQDNEDMHKLAGARG